MEYIYIPSVVKKQFVFQNYNLLENASGIWMIQVNMVPFHFLKINVKH